MTEPEATVEEAPKPRAQKPAYAWNPATFEFMGEAVAWESPLEPGTFHMPADTTEISPPARIEGKVAVWSGSTWNIVDDFRGKTVYLKTDAGYGSARTVSYLGPIQDTYTLLEPATGRDKWSGIAWVSPATDFDTWNGTAFVTDIAAMKEWKAARILAEQSAAGDALMAGYTLVEVITWPQQYAEALELKGNASAVTPLLSAFSQARGLTAAQLGDKVLEKAGVYQTALASIIARHRARQAAVEAATTVVAVLAS